jgi:hypothetical protein
MNRFFNTAGPCVPGEHYLLSATERCPEIMALVARRLYFVIHAARQSGKTTLLLELRNRLEVEGKHRALYCSLESVQGIDDPKEGLPAITRGLIGSLSALRGFDAAPVIAGTDHADYTNALKLLLQRLCAAADRPLVLLFDEVDCLAEGTLVTFLRQLRDGYVNRAGGAPFPASCALAGMRNIRDYKAQVRPGAATLGSAGPFNIAAEALTLANFTGAEVGALYAQHTADTGQAFPPEAVARAPRRRGWSSSRSTWTPAARRRAGWWFSTAVPAASGTNASSGARSSAAAGHCTSSVPDPGGLSILTAY